MRRAVELGAAFSAGVAAAYGALCWVLGRADEHARRHEARAFLERLQVDQHASAAEDLDAWRRWRAARAHR